LSFSSYGMVFVGLALGGMVLLTIFSMLSMARIQDEDQDRLEIELSRNNRLACPSDYEAIPNEIRVTVNAELKEGGATKS
jgi:hypothetical protein